MEPSLTDGAKRKMGAYTKLDVPEKDPLLGAGVGWNAVGLGIHMEGEGGGGSLQ